MRLNFHNARCPAFGRIKTYDFRDCFSRYELHSKGEWMDLEIIQSGNKATFILTVTRCLRQCLHCLPADRLNVWINNGKRS